MPTPSTSLRPWSLTWRVLLALAISLLGWSVVARYQVDEAPWWLAIDLVTVVVGFAAMALRHRHPVLVAVLTNVATAWSPMTGGPATWALFSLATRRRWREIVPVSVVSIAAGVVSSAVDPTARSSPPVLALGLILTIVGITVGWGMFVGSRRELLTTLRDRAETAEAEQAARVAAARSAERARIAREMHDVLAHRISTIAMHAGILDYRDDLSPAELRRTASVIRDSSHQALTELRQVLGVLRDDAGDAAPEPPQPTADGLPDLLESARLDGMRVDAGGLEHLEQVPPATGRVVYRTVQEGLTNARKHAPDTRVSVTVSGAPDVGLTVEVANRLRVGTSQAAGPDLSLPRSGLGLVGLTERAELAGGSLHHGRDDQSFILSLWVPWDR